MMKKIKETLTFLYTLVTNERGCCVIKTDKDNKAYGYVFRNLDWGKLDISVVSNMLPDSWQCSFGEGLDVNPRTIDTNAKGQPLATSYLYVGKDNRDKQSLKDILAIDIDVS
tara:strand:+ start:223 stop:558 length:336 start_codon:yes stop_codon:yes gene_type:complete